MRNSDSNQVKTTDVVIVGAGVIGLAMARALNEHGIKRITVIERAEPGAEASSAAAGMLAPQAEADSADELFELCVKSRDLYPGWADSLLNETGIDIELDRTGTLYLAFNENDEAELARRYHWQTDAGFPVERLSSREVLELEPSISPSVRAALRLPLDVQVENRLLVSALVTSLRQRNVDLLTGVSVESLSVVGGRITGVETEFGSIQAPIVVVAIGAWTSFLTTADSHAAPVRIEPVRGQMLCFESARPIRHVLNSPRGYVVPRHDRRILAGSTSEFAGFDKHVTGKGIRTIVDAALEIAYEAVCNAPLLSSWAGLRPRATDGLPIIGSCPNTSGLYYATGHYRNGILLAPITGELLAEQITTRNVPAMLEAFTPNRFQAMAVG